MTLPALVLATVLAHTGFVGSRVAVALYALSERASPFHVGVLYALYALLPMLLGVAAGRVVDRVGARRPMRVATVALAGGVALPAIAPSLAVLPAAATVIGTAFMVFHVAANHAVGSLGDAGSRPVRFSWWTLSFSIGGLLGPLAAGFAIDAAGHRGAFALLAFVALAGLALPRNGPEVRSAAASRSAAAPRVRDLLREPRLRAPLIASGTLAMGWDLYTFLMPLWCARSGLSASSVGVVMGCFAAATFAVRLAMPALARRVREWSVVSAALLAAGSAYALVPLATQPFALMALSLLLGAGLGSAQPMIMSLLFTASPPGRQGEVVGLRSTMLNTSHTIVPLATGALGAAIGMAAVFWLMAAFLLAGGVSVRRRAR